MYKLLKQKNNGSTSLQKKAGFTLVETLVAVSIFTGSILAMLAVLSNNLTSTNFAKRKTVATYLAQEGIEYFHNMRDTFVLYQGAGGDGWVDFLIKTTPCEKTQGSSGCYFRDEMDYEDDLQPITGNLMGLVECPNGDCPFLTYNTATGQYGYTGAENSGFQRKVNTIQLNDHELQVVSTVTWTYGGRTSTVSLSENLLNWQNGI